MSAAGPARRVLHVVRWTLPATRGPGGRTVEQLEVAARALAAIPGVARLSFGPRHETPWPGPDDGFDAAMAIMFDSPDVIPAFLEHPAHVAIVTLTGQLGATVSAWYAGMMFESASSTRHRSPNWSPWTTA
jgi:Stress responsive A/B Barrel Domain